MADDRRPAGSLDWVGLAGKSREVHAAVERQLRRRRRRWMAVAATVVAAGMVAWGGLRFAPQFVSAPAADAADPAGETYAAAGRYALADGSVMDLREGAVVEVSWRAAERRISLLQGQAFFQVSHDASRPFIVRARGCEARAVGTAYAVSLVDDRVEVLVTEGRVAVAPDDATAPIGAGSPAVAAGQNARIRLGVSPRQMEIRPMTPDAIAAGLAWRVPRLEFDGTPLRDVLQAFNRYNVAQITLGDESLGDLPVSGLLRADNFPVLLKLLDTSYAIVSRQEGDNLVLGRRSP